jgi:hypothetical protein
MPLAPLSCRRKVSLGLIVSGTAPQRWAPPGPLLLEASDVHVPETHCPSITSGARTVNGVTPLQRRRTHDNS